MSLPPVAVAATCPPTAATRPRTVPRGGPVDDADDDEDVAAAPDFDEAAAATNGCVKGARYLCTHYRR
jgi:hypothetical protein